MVNESSISCFHCEYIRRNENWIQWRPVALTAEDIALGEIIAGVVRHKCGKCEANFN